MQEKRIENITDKSERVCTIKVYIQVILTSDLMEPNSLLENVIRKCHALVSHCTGVKERKKMTDEKQFALSMDLFFIHRTNVTWFTSHLWTNLTSYVYEEKFVKNELWRGIPLLEEECTDKTVEFSPLRRLWYARDSRQIRAEEPSSPNHHSWLCQTVSAVDPGAKHNDHNPQKYHPNPDPPGTWYGGKKNNPDQKWI